MTLYEAQLPHSWDTRNPYLQLSRNVSWSGLAMWLHDILSETVPQSSLIGGQHGSSQRNSMKEWTGHPMTDLLTIAQAWVANLVSRCIYPCAPLSLPHQKMTSTSQGMNEWKVLCCDFSSEMIHHDYYTFILPTYDPLKYILLL